MFGLKVPAVESPEDEVDKLVGSILTLTWSLIRSIKFVKEISPSKKISVHLSRFVLHRVTKINDNNANIAVKIRAIVT